MDTAYSSDAQAAVRRDAFLQDVIQGLDGDPKSLPCKWFYDATGSALYDEITRAPEYYPTRTEVAILKSKAEEIAESVGSNAALVEFGPGATTKTGIVLEAMDEPHAYVPIDVSETFLDQISEIVRADFPDLNIVPVLADFMKPVELTRDRLDGARLVGFFPGSTIGNLSDDDIRKFLRNARRMLGADGLLVIGYDLAKDPSVLEAAYDDAGGATARFNLNLLARINRELGADFDLKGFAHRAIWNADASRIEMHLVSQRDQTVTVGDHTFDFAKGETIHTENSRKFIESKANALFRSAGWSPLRQLTDSDQMFAVTILKPAE